jgi:plastocyanin
MCSERVRAGVVGTLALALALAAAACGGGAPHAPASTPAAAAEPAQPSGPPAGPVDPSTAGEITGRVVFEGTPPQNPAISMVTEPACVAAYKGTTPRQPYYVVGPNGGLANVFVYVKSGLRNYSFPVPTTPVEIDQHNCAYEPHVFGIRVGQPLLIVNSDPFLHNIHAHARVNEEFNTGQPLQGMKATHVFTTPEIMLPFKCDIHRWMNAYAGVMPNPYFAVSATDGTFDIRTLPPGRYVLAAWHEKLGEQTVDVTVGPKQTQNVSFTFKTR